MATSGLFPLRPAPDANLKLMHLDHETRQKLCFLLDNDGQWLRVKSLAEEALQEGRNNTSSVLLVSRVGDAESLMKLFAERFLWTVEVLAVLLLRAGMDEALFLLKEVGMPSDATLVL